MLSHESGKDQINNRRDEKKTSDNYGEAENNFFYSPPAFIEITAPAP
jgi:hypothetical protein